MYDENDLKLHDLKVANTKEISDIYDINQALIPDVGSLKDIGTLKKLIELSKISEALKVKGELVGFYVCFGEKSEYDSINYKYFNKKYSRFLYVDRIGIKKSFENRGFGKYLYSNIFKKMRASDQALCAEVNILPKNERSLIFHENLGFTRVLDKEINHKYKVTYMEYYASRI